MKQKLFIVVNVDKFFLSHRKDVAIAAQNAGYDVIIVAKDTGMSDEIVKLGLGYIDLSLNPTGENPLEELKTLLFLFKLYLRNRSAIFHHVGVKVILWGSLAAKLVSVKGSVSAISGLGVLFSKQTIKSKLILRILRFSHSHKNTLAIFQNDDDKFLFLQNNIIRTSQVKFIKGSGVDLECFNYNKEEKTNVLKILFAARMIKEKGVLDFVAAAKILKKKYFGKVEFLLCGGLDKNPTALKESELYSMCDEGYISWLGFCSDMKSQLVKSHIVAFPSYYREGLPKSLIEACAIGRPIVTTNSVGCRDAVIDGYNGFLIPIMSPSVLAEKLDELISNPTLRNMYGKNSRKYAENNFSIRDVERLHIDIYNELSLSI